MDRIKVVLDFRGRKYTGVKEFNPPESRGLIRGIPANLREILRKDEDKRRERQKILILNHLTGRLGEEILKDFLISRGYEVSELGTYKVFSSIGDMEAGKLGKDVKHLIECKTCRNMYAGLRIRQNQINRYKLYRGVYQIDVIYFGVFIKLQNIKEHNNPLKLGEDATIYEYEVKQIRNLNPYVKQSQDKNKRTICIMPHKFLRGTAPKTKTPEFFAWN